MPAVAAARVGRFAHARDHASVDRSPRRPRLVSPTVVAVAMVLYHMWVIVAGQPEAIIFRGTHLMFALVLVFLIYGSKVGVQRPIPNFMTAAGARRRFAALPVHQLRIRRHRIYYIDDLTWADMIFGTILIVVVTEATRRCVDLSLPVTSILFLLYGLFIAKLEPMRILDQLYMTTEGIFGQALAVSASFVIIFVVFGSFMEKTGVGQLFMDFAMALTGTAGGPGKVSVISSSLFGTISGSAVANVMVDGPISIPLMKRFGSRRISPPASRRPPRPAGRSCRRSWGRCLRHGRVPGGAVQPDRHLGGHPGDPLLRRLLRGGAFRGQAPRHRRRAARACRGCASSWPSADLFLPIIILLVVMYSGYSAPLAALAARWPASRWRCKSTRVNVTLPNVIDAMVEGERTRSRSRSPARPPAS